MPRRGLQATRSVRLPLLADTHVPVRARHLPAEVWAQVDRADVMVHAGDRVDVALLDRLQARAGAAYPDVDLLVFGHSHIPWDTVAPGGLRLRNPGSPTDRRRQPACSYLTAQVRDGALADVELHPLAGAR